MDPKGRISLPVRFRESLEGGLTITLGLGGCLAAFPQDEWVREADRVDRLTREAAGDPRYARVLFNNAEQVGLDSQGRLVVPARLRAKAGLHRDVTVSGTGRHLEIWDSETFRRRAQADEAAFAAGTLKPQAS
jgi:MraZ protein